ncbi:hypothetical protein ABT297_12690 [Dactylosporangium sp. NPDC000555]|uniref:hypothetical protein n=1 Tax=Dactylosporangium sp. NPDC000555 TaxID=3154260 RepID=UPI003324A839
MVEEYHPDWCDRAACTAYGPRADGYHRSEPFVLATDGPGVQLYVYKVADWDGTNESIEIAQLERRTADKPWHLREPLREMHLPQTTATALQGVLAKLA